MDEAECAKANKVYMKAVRKYHLHKIRDGHGQGTKRYMSDSFISGFYAGRDYLAQLIGNRTGTDSTEDLIQAFNKMKSHIKDEDLAQRLGG